MLRPINTSTHVIFYFYLLIMVLTKAIVIPQDW